MALPHHRSTPIPRYLIFIGLVLILVLNVCAYPVIAASLANDNVLDVIEQEQFVTIDGTSLMQPINQTIKQRFEQEYPAANVTLRSNGTDSALEALLKNDIDLAAIGRPLSVDEKAKGLIEIPVSQDAISIIIGCDNPFQGHLTLDQFAQIFRGEILDWSDVGGTPGPIRFIDRPLASDTRFVLSKYGILGESEQAQGEQVVRMATDDTADVIRQLKDDGISYAIASQVKDQQKIKLVKIAVLLDTLPDDQYYPYSQIRGYAYKKDNATAALSFVDWVTGESGKAAVTTAKIAEAAAVETALNPPVSSPEKGLGGLSRFPLWLWGLLPLPLLLFLLGQFKRQQPMEDSPGQMISPEKTVESELSAPSGKLSESTLIPSMQEALPQQESVLQDPAPVQEPTTTSDPSLVTPEFTESVTSIDPIVSSPSVSSPSLVESEKIASELADPIASPSPVPVEADVPSLSAQAYYDQGWQLMDAEQFSDAVGSFERALEVDPTEMLAWIGKGTAFLKVGRYEDAIASLDQGLTWINRQDLALIPGGLLLVSTAWLNRGRANLKAGQLEAALADFEQALQLDKMSLDALRAKGDALLSLGRQDAASTCYEQANAFLIPPLPVSKPSETTSTRIPELSPTPISLTDDSPASLSSPEPTLPFEQTTAWYDSNAVYQKGLNALKLGQFSDAKLCFQRTLELSPNNVLGLIGLGQVFLKFKEGGNALIQFNQAIAIEPNEPEAWIGKGKALRLLGQLDAALNTFDQALQFNETAVDALRSKGDIFNILGRQDDANRCYSEANTIVRGTPIPVWTFKPSADKSVSSTSSTVPAADTSVESKESTLVSRLFGEAPSVKLTSVEKTVDWNDSDLVCQEGSQCLKLGQLNDAESCFRRVLELSPENILGVIGLGKVFLKLRQGENALTQFNQAIDRAPTRSDAWMGKGDALVLLGQMDEGQQSYAQAVALRSSPPPSSPTIAGPDEAVGSQPLEVKPSETLQPQALIRSAPVDQPAQPPLIPTSLPQQLDMVILVNTQSPIQADVVAMQQVMSEAIATITSARPADVRITWLGTHGSWDATPVQQSVSAYLNSLDISSVSYVIDSHHISPCDAITLLIEHFDWRPGSAQTLLYLDNESLNKNNQYDNQATIQSIVRAARNTGTTISTYLPTATPASPNATAAIAEYNQLALATGGCTFIAENQPISYRDILEQTIEQGCRECIYRRLTINSQGSRYVLDQGQMERLQSSTSSTLLSPGSYIIRINSGAFSDGTNAPGFEPEPWVVLWIDGGRCINQKTGIEVGATWITLNGYDDSLKLTVVEETNVCALFIDTSQGDYSGQVILSILKTN